MSKRIPLHISLLLPFVLLVVPACYTLLTHPRVKRDAYYREVTDRRCNTCHGREELWSFHQVTSPNLASFFAVPWWYNGNWYYEGDPPSAVPDPATKPHDPTIVPPGANSQPPAENSPAKAQGDSKQGGSHEEASKNRTVRRHE
jgi:hypothetical protein